MGGIARDTKLNAIELPEAVAADRERVAPGPIIALCTSTVSKTQARALVGTIEVRHSRIRLLRPGGDHRQDAPGRHEHDLKPVNIQDDTVRCWLAERRCEASTQSAPAIDGVTEPPRSRPGGHLPYSRCVVYEMLTGKRAFDGEDVSEILARVIEREPDWSVLPANTPPGIRRLLKRCLEKNVKERRRDAGDVIADIEDATTDAPSVVAERRTNAAISRLGWAAAATMALVVAGLGAYFREEAPEPTREMRVDITRCDFRARAVRVVSGRQHRVRCLRGRAATASRRLDQTVAQPLPGSEDALAAFWSPDSRSIVFSTSPRHQTPRYFRGGVPAVLADRFAEERDRNSDGVILVAAADKDL